MTETSGFSTISTKLQQIAGLARRAPTMAFTTLAHHIDIDWLKEACRLTREDGATGVDGQRVLPAGVRCGRVIAVACRC